MSRFIVGYMAAVVLSACKCIRPTSEHSS